MANIFQGAVRMVREIARLNVHPLVVAATGFLKTNPTPTRAELAHGISGNLCRCADYNKILDCMMNAAELARRA